MGIKEMKKFIFPILLLAALSACDDQYAGLQYRSAFNEAYDSSGTGKAIPLTVEKSVELDGTITNNGAYVCFSSDRENGNFDIYLRELNDIETARLTTHAASDYSPAISPNGKYVAFVSNRDDPEGDIFYARIRPKNIMKLKKSILQKSLDVESSLKNITRVQKADGSLDSVKDANPSWSPNTSEIVFSSTRGDGYTENIWLARRDGKSMRQLTEKGGMYPRFSPDGRKIVFISYRNRNSNGDVFIYDLATGEETEVTSGPEIDLNPSFTGNSSQIIYTRISEDTNRNGQLDLKDRSDLYFQDIENRFSYKLIYSEHSVFSAKYFPALKMKYNGSRNVNFNGIIIYSEQNGQDINLNMIPEYGIIPKRINAGEQLKLAERYADESVSYEQMLESFMRVYYFFGKSTDPDDRNAVLKALKMHALYSKKTGKNSSIDGIISIIKGSTNLKSSSYSKLILDYLSSLEKGITEGGAYLEKSLGKFPENQEDHFSDYMIYDDLGRHYAFFGDNEKAAAVYARMLEKFPENPDYNQTSYRYVQSSEKYDDNFIKLLKEPSYRNRLEYFIIREIEKKNFDAVTLRNIDQKEEIKFLNDAADFSEAFADFSKGNYAKARAGFLKILSQQGISSIIAYKCNLYLYEIDKRLKKYDSANLFLSTAMLKYDPQWNDPSYSGYVDQLIDYYEEAGLRFEGGNQIEKANDLYKNYAGLVDKFKTDSRLSGYYDKYGARSQVLLIDTYIKRYPGRMDKLTELENEYLLGLNDARKNYDKIHVYGLAYIYLNKALLLDYYYKNGNIKQAGSFSASDISSNISKCIEQLDWSLFMDDLFIDAYMLKNWTNQYVEVRKREEKENRGSLYSKLEKNFSPLLLEGNINSYLKAIEKNNEKLKPEEEGNLYLNLGNSYFLINNFLKASDSYRNAEKFKTVFSSQKEEALFYFHYAYSYWQLGNVKQARAEIDKSYQIYSYLSKGTSMKANADKMINLLRFYSLFESLNGNYAKAVEIYKEIINLASAYKVDIDFSMYELDIAYCYKQMGMFDESFVYLNSAGSRLSRKGNNDRKYFLQVKFLGLGPVGVYNLGPDSAAFGNTRLFAPLSNLEKQIFMYSIYEDIYLANNDYDHAIEILRNKEKAAGKRNTIFSRDVRVRALNNAGFLNFKKSRFKESIADFRQAMKLASDENNSDLEGYFISVNNLANLYQYAAENRIKMFDDPERSFSDLISVIQKYRNDYEKNRYKAELKALEASLKAEGKKVTAEDRMNLSENIAIEAEKIYYRIDLIIANLNFYRTDLSWDGISGKTGASEVYSANKSLYDSYMYSRNVYENIHQNYFSSIDPYSQVKIIINLAEINARTAGYDRAFSYFGEAEKLATEYEMKDLLADINFKQARFLSEYYRKVNQPADAAEKYYRAADSLITAFPPFFYGNLSKISNYYREYAFYLAGKNDARGSLASFEFSKKLLILKCLMDQSTESGEKQLMKGLVKSASEYQSNIRKIVAERTSGVKDDSAQTVKLKKRNIDLAAAENRSFRSSGIGYLVQRNVPLQKLKNTVITCEYGNGNFYLYKISGDKFELSVLKADSTKDIGSQVTGLLREKSAGSDDAVVLLNEFLIDNIPPIQKGDGSAVFNSAFLAEFIRNDSIEVFADSASYLKKGFLSLDAAEMQAAGISSVLCDNETSLTDISNLLQTDRLSPVLLIKRAAPDSGYQDILYFAFSSYYSGLPGVMLYYGSGNIPEKSGFPEFASAAVNLSSVNFTGDDKGMYINFGTTGLLHPDGDNSNGSAYFKEMENAMKAGKFRQARVNLRKWQDLKPEKIFGENEYYTALIFSRENRYQNALESLSSVNLKKIDNADLRSRCEDMMVFLHLQLCDVSAAEKTIAECIAPDSKMMQFYRMMINYIRFGGSPAVPDGSMKADRVILNLKYVHAVSGLQEAAKLLKKSGNYDFSVVNEADRLYISGLGASSFTGSDAVLKNLYEEKNDKVINEWRIRFEEADSSDIFKLQKKHDAAGKNHDYIKLINQLNELDFKGYQPADNVLDAAVILSDYFRILSEAGDSESAGSLYQKMRANRYLFSSFSVPFIIRTIIEDFAVSENPYFSRILDDFEKKTESGSTLVPYVTEMKILSAASENNFKAVGKLIASADENYFRQKGFYHFSVIFAKLGDSLKNPELLKESELLFASYSGYLNDRSASQKFLAYRIIDSCVAAENKAGNYSRALDLLSLKKQLEFHFNSAFQLTYNSSFSAAGFSENSRERFYSEVNMMPVADYTLKKLSADSVILEFEKSGSDLLVYRLKTSGIDLFEIKKGYEKITEITGRYREILRKQEDTLIISQELADLFSDVFSGIEDFKDIYIVHDKFTGAVPFELVKTDSILMNDYNIYYLSSLKNALITPALVKQNISVEEDQQLLENRLLSIVLRETGIKSDQNSGNMHFMKKLKFNRYTNRFENGLVSSLGKIRFVIINENADQLSENRITDTCFYEKTDFVMIASPYVRDVNISAFYRNFYDKFRKSQNVKAVFSIALRETGNTPKYKNAANWEKIRLYVNGI